MPVAISTDGTPIAYDVSGSGPPLVLIDGAMCHRMLGPAPKLVPMLSRDFTVVSYDRRGRGESGNTAPYEVAREIDDVAAVIAAAGLSSVFVAGMSSGAALGLRAVTEGLPITRLAMFEPPFVGAHGPDSLPPADAYQQLRDLVSHGENGAAISYFLTRIYGMPAAAVGMFKLFRRMWNKTKATAPSLPHEVALMGDWQPPAESLAALTIPTLVICGEKSPAKLRAAYNAVRDANPSIASADLARQGHNVSIKVLAPVLRDFLAQHSTDDPNPAPNTVRNSDPSPDPKESTR